MGASLGQRSKGRGRRGHYRPMAEINVTPFVDVMLVLLIVFMVAAPLLTTGIAVDLPDSQAKAMSEEDNAPIEITVTKEGNVYIGDSKIDSRALITKLRAMTAGKYDRRIYIRGDQKLSYGQVMRIIGEVNAAGFNKVALLSEKQ
jgi:biopolymer transport protein TolR